jgi:U3 small nucleolar RNA-associated protein 10
MEVLGTKSLPGSLDLVSCLLETLHNTVQYALSTQADLSFVQQLSMSAIENAAEQITVRYFICLPME